MGFVVSVNGHFIIVFQNKTILQLCESINCFVPRFCYQPMLNIAGNCRMCLVSVYGIGKPVASCTVFVSVGMAIYTTSFFVNKIQERVLEFLLLNHPLDCPVCDQGGICDLQDQRFFYGSEQRRFWGIKRRVSNINLGFFVRSVLNRCIQCSRCVRFLGEYSSNFFGRRPILLMSGRGQYSKVTTYDGLGLNRSWVANIIDLCPVGALTKKPYHFIGRPWESQKIVSYDLSCASINKVYFSTVVEGDFLVSVRAIDGFWIRNQRRFAYDAFSFLPRGLVIPNTFKLPLSLGSVFLGRDLRLFDLAAISFYCDGLGFNIEVFSRIPIVDKTRPCFWGGALLSSFSSFDFILLVGAGISQIAPRLFAKIREAFCFGSFIASFGPVGADFILVSCGNRFSDFLRFVLGYHRGCLMFSISSKPLILFSTILFSRVFSNLWVSLVDKLYFLGCVVKFINVYANEIAYYYSASFGRMKSIRLFSKLEGSVSIFGYLIIPYIEFLWSRAVSIEFYCGCWPLNLRSYQSLPLSFQNTSVLTSQGKAVLVTPFVSGRSSFLFDYSVNDILLLALGVKYWSVPQFNESNIFVLDSTWAEPLDFYVKSVVSNCLLQFIVGWVPLVRWVERSYSCRQFQLFQECFDFNFLLFSGCYGFVFFYFLGFGRIGAYFVLAFGCSFFYFGRA
jgi:hypothetical protein